MAAVLVVTRKPTRGWWVIGAFVVVHNIVAAGQGKEMLSEAFDRWMISHPRVATGVVAAVALHLINWLPPRYDPIHIFFEGCSELRRRLG